MLHWIIIYWNLWKPWIISISVDKIIRVLVILVMEWSPWNTLRSKVLLYLESAKGYYQEKWEWQKLGRFSHFYFLFPCPLYYCTQIRIYEWIQSRCIIWFKSGEITLKGIREVEFCQMCTHSFQSLKNYSFLMLIHKSRVSCFI